MHTDELPSEIWTIIYENLDFRSKLNLAAANHYTAAVLKFSKSRLLPKYAFLGWLMCESEQLRSQIQFEIESVFQALLVCNQACNIMNTNTGIIPTMHNGLTWCNVNTVLPQLINTVLKITQSKNQTLAISNLVLLIKHITQHVLIILNTQDQNTQDQNTQDQNTHSQNTQDQNTQHASVRLEIASFTNNHEKLTVHIQNQQTASKLVATLLCFLHKLFKHV